MGRFVTDNMSIPDGMTPDKLRKIARWMDLIDMLADQLGALWRKLGMVEQADMLEALRGNRKNRDTIQADLRRWADQITPQRTTTLDEAQDEG